MNIYARLGAIVYILWGILHVEAARRVYGLGLSLDPGMVQARIFQDAWNLLFFALFGIIVAIFYNWKNSRMGFWLNATVVSAGDIGFILALLIPGYLPWVPAGLGPLLWIIALGLTAAGIYTRK
jgi:hypothetical protein